MAQNSEGLKALRELTTLIDLKVIDSSNSSKRQTAITREPEESTDSESDDLREWSAPSADSLDVPALFKVSLLFIFYRVETSSVLTLANWIMTTTYFALNNGFRITILVASQT